MKFTAAFVALFACTYAATTPSATVAGAIPKAELDNIRSTSGMAVKLPKLEAGEYFVPGEPREGFYEISISGAPGCSATACVSGAVYGATKYADILGSGTTITAKTPTVKLDNNIVGFWVYEQGVPFSHLIWKSNNLIYAVAEKWGPADGPSDETIKSANEMIKS